MRRLRRHCLPNVAVAVAWELKDLCYAAWSSEPQRAAKAAEALRLLCAVPGPDAVPPRQQREMEALADWTAGIACLTRGDMAGANACFDLAAGIFRGLGEAHHAAQTQVPNIMALSMLGQHALAAECAERTQREFVAQGDVRAAGKVSLNLGSLHLRRDEFQQAARHYREAAVLFARVGDREHSVMADIGLADALTSLGDFDEAMRIYARAAMRAAHSRLAGARSDGRGVGRAARARARTLPRCARRLRGVAPSLRAARHAADTWPSRKSSWPTRISNCICCPKRSRCSTRR